MNGESGKGVHTLYWLERVLAHLPAVYLKGQHFPRNPAEEPKLPIWLQWQQQPLCYFGPYLPLHWTEQQTVGEELRLEEQMGCRPGMMVPQAKGLLEEQERYQVVDSGRVQDGGGMLLPQSQLEQLQLEVEGSQSLGPSLRLGQAPRLMTSNQGIEELRV